MKLAMLTPLPPARTGVAHYASLVVPALRQVVDLQAFESLEGYRAEAYDAAIYQLGNNPHHEVMYREAMRRPGIVVLHDLVLHHLIVELTLARGDAEGYVRALEASHGAAGAAWARGRAHGLHSEMGNFLLPASVELARRARAVIVHNRYAAERLRSFGVTTPIHVVAHPYVPETGKYDRDAIRARCGIGADERVIGFFGFLTSAKRAEVVLEAFRLARQREPRLRLLIVGEPAPNIDAGAILGDGITATGYATDEEFPMFYAAADRFVNLRYPTAGETSGTLIRALDAGKPVALSDYAQFAEFPGDCVFKVPLDREVERLVEFFTSDLPSPAAAQRKWLEEHARIEKTVEGYLAALEQRPPERLAAVHRELPLFASVELVAQRVEGSTMHLTIRNNGEATLRTRTYGTPVFRLIAQLVQGGRVVQDRWLELPCDLRPGETAEVSFSQLSGPAHPAASLRLLQAIQDVPDV